MRKQCKKLQHHASEAFWNFTCTSDEKPIPKGQFQTTEILFLVCQFYIVWMFQPIQKCSSQSLYISIQYLYMQNYEVLSVEKCDDKTTLGSSHAANCINTDLSFA